MSTPRADGQQAARREDDADHGESPAKRPKSHSLDKFDHLAGLGPWRVALKAAIDDHRSRHWLEASQYSFDFRKRPLDNSEVGARRAFTFGVQSDDLNYALPCPDLRCNGRSWFGKVVWDVWKGSGAVVMENLWNKVSARLNLKPDADRDSSLLCVLTIDDVEDPQDVIWQIVRHGGESLIRVPLERTAATGGMRFASGGSGEEASNVVRVEGLVRLGPWMLPHYPRNAEHAWLAVCEAHKFKLNFKKRRIPERGGAYTLAFGGYGDKTNWAYPCPDLVWNHQLWTGRVELNNIASGRGSLVMEAFRDALRHRLGGGVSDGVPLLCVLTLNEIESPSEPEETQLTLRVVRSGEALMSVALMPCSSARCRGQRRRSAQVVHFRHLVSSGQWRPADAAEPEGHPWKHWLPILESSLAFKLRKIRKNFVDSPARYTFGAQATLRNYAIPCADLVWDGLVWRSNVTWDLKMGGGRLLMEVLRQDLRYRLRTELSQQLSCVLTFDSLNAPREGTWQIVRPSGEAVVEMAIKACGRPETAYNAANGSLWAPRHLLNLVDGFSRSPDLHHSVLPIQSDGELRRAALPCADSSWGCRLWSGSDEDAVSVGDQALHGGAGGPPPSPRIISPSDGHRDAYAASVWTSSPLSRSEDVAVAGAEATFSEDEAMDLEEEPLDLAKQVDDFAGAKEAAIVSQAGTAAQESIEQRRRESRARVVFEHAGG